LKTISSAVERKKEGGGGGGGCGAAGRNGIVAVHQAEAFLATLANSLEQAKAGLQPSQGTSASKRPKWYITILIGIQFRRLPAKGRVSSANIG